jgi:mono/diheme cytochrome c family protein
MPRTLKALLPAFLAAWLTIGVSPAMAQDAAVIAKGEYLARAGDCIACHTAREGKTFAGGLPMKTPFRNALHFQHHARSADRHRDVDVRPVLPDDA